MSPAHSRVRCVRLIIYRMLARPPRKSTFVYNNPTKACTVSTYPFGQRRNDNVTSVLERFSKVGLERDNNSIVLISRKSTKMHNSIHYSHQSTYRRKCGVYNDWQAMRVCRLTNSVQITNLKRWVRYTFTEECPCLLIHGSFKVGRIFGIDEANCDTKFG
jgi:hypothetical protein